ncbi:MAG TPA: ornithine carbamoyltransferase [Candidatus Limnocylindrales bacterium]|nr:ornithine carbamoyltransferase [Candidatus Limnocylindrales bacterium]
MTASPPLARRTRRPPGLLPRHVLTLRSLGAEGLRAILDLSAAIKSNPDRFRNALAGRKVGLVFEKPSTRTRVSFEAAAWLLGMLPISLRGEELQLGRGETIADTARTLSLYVDAIAIRTFAQSRVEELAAAASVPVINALTDEHHPCQVVADLLTLREEFGALTALPVAFVGDGDNVCASLIEAAGLTGLDLRVATPEGYDPDPAIVEAAREDAEQSHATITLIHDPAAAAFGARAVYADVWTSMGREGDADARRAAFAGYRVDEALLRWVDPTAIFLHCLPAHRGEEVTDEVIDGPRSRVWREAGNRQHTEAALLYALLTGDLAGPTAP